MASHETTVGAAAPELPNGIAIEIESDATIGYASIQNDVPVVRSLRLTNNSAAPVEDLQVLITCNVSGNLTAFCSRIARVVRIGLH